MARLDEKHNHNEHHNHDHKHNEQREHDHNHKDNTHRGECCSTDKSGHAHGGDCCSIDKSGHTHEGDCCGGDTKLFRLNKLAILLISLASLIISFVQSRGFLSFGALKYIDFGIIAVVLCGLPLMVTAAKKLARGKGFTGKVSSALLVSIAIIACITLQILYYTGVTKGDGHDHSYIFAAAEIAFLMFVGELIEAFTVGKARSGISRLVGLAPLTARVMVDGVIVDTPLERVKKGDIVSILPDGVISVDGEIVEGETAVDQSVMTGESLPVDKKAGDTVFGGTWNKGGAITVRVLKAKDEMAVTRLKRLVEEAEGQKAPISRLAERVSGYIVPAAIILALVVFGVNMIFMNTGVFAVSVAESIERGVTMLVVICPCALALATPVAVAAGLGNGAKNGVLIKSGAAVEMLGRIDTVALDKTGTITSGVLSVDTVVALSMDEDSVLGLASGVEALSAHPIAKAICAKKPMFAAKNIQSHTAVGVSGEVDGSLVAVQKWSDDLTDSAETVAKAHELLGQGKTLCAVKKQGRLVGLIALSDTVKTGAAVCIDRLKSMNIRTVMLTGDNQGSAKFIARQAGIEDGNVFHSLLPEDKLSRVKELSKQGKVCMVGDGVNDAPALAAADVSVAMAALGSEVAIETASAAIMSSDINKVPSLIRLGRKVLLCIKINIAISLAISFLSVGLSMIGVLGPALGALVHNVSSVLVAANSALLLRNKF